MALLVLPSALNVPQSTPSQTLEFAPVPPTDDEPPPPDAGNTSSLGLGSSGSLGTMAVTAEQAGVGIPEIPIGVGASPVTKRCVGSPPRQTEDALAPPCVAFFEGDNGGATAPGVSGGEVRVLVYKDPDSGEVGGELYDLGEPPEDGEYLTLGEWRIFQTHFNQRYQTYGRRVHFWVHYADETTTPEQRTADAIRALDEVDPFAVISYAAGNAETYVGTLTNRDRLVFLGNPEYGAEAGLGAEQQFYAGAAGKIWSFWPTIERRAALYATSVCREFVPHEVSYSGQAADLGTPRAFGVLRAADPARRDLDRYWELVTEAVGNCGGNVVATGTFRRDSTICTDPSNAVANMAELQSKGTTTILFGGALNVCHSQTASGMNWLPEWFVMPDGDNNASWFARNQDARAWEHARGMTLAPLRGLIEDDICVRAAVEADPSVEGDYTRTSTLCLSYPDARQLFTGIQVAGPMLTNDNLERGFRAIPAIPSDDAAVETCFYRPGEYTCLQDAQVQWWDPTGDDPQSSAPGCWRSREGGRRYLVGTWPQSDITVLERPSDPCNGQGVPYPPPAAEQGQ